MKTAGKIFGVLIIIIAFTFAWSITMILISLGFKGVIAVVSGWALIIFKWVFNVKDELAQKAKDSSFNARMAKINKMARNADPEKVAEVYNEEMAIWFKDQHEKDSI